MEEVGRILPAVLRKRGGLDEARVAEMLASLWRRVAGKSIAEYSRPVAFEAGTLTLATSGESWTLQLRQMSEELRAEINSFLGAPVVKKLRVERRDFAEAASPRAVEPAASAKLKTKPLELASSGARLDPEMARLVERSFAKYFSR